MTTEIVKTPIYRIKIVYKSGHVHETEYFEFKVHRQYGSGMQIEWKLFDTNERALLFGVDDIESIWQTGVRFIGKLVIEELKEKVDDVKP